MKKQLVACVRLRSLFFTASCIFLFNICAKAQNATAQTSLTTGAVVRYLPSKGTTSQFQVFVPNEKGETFSLSIKDAYGNLLFTDKYSDVGFEKKYLITEVDKNAKLVFVIRSLKDKRTQTFETNTISRIMEDVVVTRLK